MMFQRLARNFINFGYFPTDSETLGRILNALAPCETGQMAIFDPTAGEGVALAECQHHLGKARTNAYAVEIDEERALHAKTLVTHCIHGDLMNCVISPRSFGLVFFNPPYGDLSKDHSGGHFTMEGRARLEKLYYRRTVGTLQKGGVMVLILPHYAIDAAFADWMSDHLVNVRAFLAPVQTYKQVVILGVRGEATDKVAKAQVRGQLTGIGQGELPETFPEQWLDTPYRIPAATVKSPRFSISQLDAKQLAEVIAKLPCLWTQFEQRFHHSIAQKRRPLTDLSQWHLALALAAGHVSGRIQSQDGRIYLIRGSTHKMQQERVHSEVDDKGVLIQTRIRLDRFVPVLRALDMTPHSATFGRVLTIR